MCTDFVCQVKCTVSWLNRGLRVYLDLYVEKKLCCVFFGNFTIFLNKKKTLLLDFIIIKRPKNRRENTKAYVRKNLLIPKSNFWKCGQGADLAAVKVWHLKTSPITLKLFAINLLFLMTQNGPTQSLCKKDIYYFLKVTVSQSCDRIIFLTLHKALRFACTN